MRIADGEFISRDLNAVLHATDGKRRRRRTPLRGGSGGALGGSGWRFGVYAEALLEVGTVSRGSAANTRRQSPGKSFRCSVVRSSRLWLLAAHLRLDRLWTHSLSAGRLPNYGTAS